MTASTVTPFLMFTGRAEEAMTFYTATFPGSSILSLERYGADGPGKEGTVYKSRMQIFGQELMFFDSPPVHAFTFTPSISFFVTCREDVDIDAVFHRLAEGGQIMMPIDAYPFSPRFGWVGDRFGVSWQLSRPV